MGVPRLISTFFSFVLLFLCVRIFGVASVKLDPDGGYSLVVGISDEAVHVVNEPVSYISEVQKMISNFAQLLWTSTNSTFHIKTVELVIPSEWDWIPVAGGSSGATYDQADIRLTNSTTEPFAENYYPCGRPGVRIQLPFMATNETWMWQVYGSQAKGLLNLWLRYRFGVWEEHGYPGHPITPYVYNENDIEHSNWMPTSCNDVPLDGNFEYMKAGEIVLCSLDGTLLMPTECRFKPPWDQVTKSSVMNFQWIDSITDLCDESTHNKHAPNRQNLYCDHKSIWEVIRESADYKMLNTTREGMVELPRVEFRVVYPTPKPHLYILLDLSNPDIAPGQPMYNAWVKRLERFVDELPCDVVTTFVVYPNLDENSTLLLPVVEWTFLHLQEKLLMNEALNFGTIQPGTVVDFRLAMYEAVSQLKERSHPNGVVLLILRTEDGINPATFPRVAAFEQDFLLDFNRYGITLYAIAVNIKDDERPAFEYLASESGGVSALIRTEDDDPAEKMGLVLDPLILWLLSQKEQPRDEMEYEIIYKESVPVTSGTSVLIPKRSDVDKIYIHVTTSSHSDGLSYIRFQLPDSSVSPFTERIEWTQNISHIPQNHVYSNKFNLSELSEYETPSWELYMTAPEEDWFNENVTVMVLILIYGSRSRKSAEQIRETAFPGTSNNIRAEVSTSAIDNEYDCNSMEVSVEPLAIYVKLQENSDGRPILFRNSHQSDPTSSILFGKILHLDSGAVLSTVLDDSGRDADLLEGDGVYSGYIYPKDKGDYRVYVTFLDYKSGELVEVNHTISPMGRLPSREQDDLEVMVNGTTLNTPYSIVFESPVPIRSLTDCRGKRHISRVVDAQVEVTEIDTEIVRVSFTVPGMTSSVDVSFEDNEWEQYYMGLGRLAEDIDTLIDDVGRGELNVFIIPMALAGQEVSTFLSRNNSLAFAFELLDYRQSPTKSTASNIVSIKGWRPENHDGGDDDPDTWCDMDCVIAIGSGCGLLILIFALISLFLWRRNRRQHTQLMLLSRDEVKEFLHGHLTSKSENSKKAGPISAQAQANEYLDTSERIQSLPYDAKYEIPNNKLHIDRTELLGSGTFGNVYKGYVVNMPGATGKVLVVAVKTMKPNMDKSCFMALLTEVKLMTQIGISHPNIVKLIGACTKNIRKCEVFLATAFCENGSLSSYLLKLNETNFKNLIDETGQLELWDEAKGRSDNKIEMATTWTLIKWAREIANGMAFLGQKKIVHGDLAARNILLDAPLVAKIGDFGLSKKMLQTYGSYNYQTEVEVEGGGLLPWKWLAPEALTYMKFSVASDVWAYGVTIWEIFTLGQVPYPGVKWSPDFVNQLEKGGLRLQKPNFATDTVYEIMSDCWQLDLKLRAGFNQIKSDFDQMLTEGVPGDYMTLQ